MSCERASGDTGREEGEGTGSAFIRAGGRAGGAAPGRPSPHRRRDSPPSPAAAAGVRWAGAVRRVSPAGPACVPGGPPARPGWTESAAGAVKSLVSS